MEKVGKVYLHPCLLEGVPNWLAECVCSHGCSRGSHQRQHQHPPA